MSTLSDEGVSELLLLPSTSETGPETQGQLNSYEMTDSNMAIPKSSGFRTIEIVGRLVFAIIMKCWGLCTTALLILLLTFWLYGGLVAFSLLCVAVLGKFPPADSIEAGRRGCRPPVITDSTQGGRRAALPAEPPAVLPQLSPL